MTLRYITTKKCYQKPRKYITCQEREILKYFSEVQVFKKRDTEILETRTNTFSAPFDGPYKTKPRKYRHQVKKLTNVGQVIITYVGLQNEDITTKQALEYRSLERKDTECPKKGWETSYMWRQLSQLCILHDDFDALYEKLCCTFQVGPSISIRLHQDDPRNPFSSSLQENDRF